MLKSHILDNIYDPVFKAILDDDINYLEQLVRTNPELLDKQNWSETNPQTSPLLFSASKLNRSASFQKLITLGANVNSKDQYGITSLMKQFKNFSECRDFPKESRSIIAKHITKNINLLLQNGADLNTADNDGKTALIYAIENLPHSFNSMVLLIQKGANLNLTDNNGKSPLAHLLTKPNLDDKKSEALLKIFLRRGADQYHPSVIQTFHNKPIMNVMLQQELLESYHTTKELHDAVINEDIDKITSLIIKYPGALNRQRVSEHNGVLSPLMLAAYHGKERSLETLLALGADINAKDKSGYSALTHAIREGHNGFPAISPLLRSGADVNIQCNEGKTPLAHIYEGPGEINPDDAVTITRELLAYGADSTDPSVINTFFRDPPQFNIPDYLQESFQASRQLLAERFQRELTRRTRPATSRFIPTKSKQLENRSH